MSTTDTRGATQDDATPLRGLTGRYSLGDGVELRGTRRALLALGELLADGGTAAIRRLEVPPGASPEPYDLFLTEVRVASGDGATRIGLEGTVLLIGGAPEGLRLLGENVGWLAGPDGAGSTAESSGHLHVEYYHGHPFLSPDSEPLVLTVDL